MSELTPDDTRALRNADTLCFDHMADGTGRIRAIRETPGLAYEHVITVELSRVQTYTGPVGPVVGYVYKGNARYNDEMRTLVRHMTTGALVSLEWARGNSSPVLNDAGVVRDELRVWVQPRGSKRADAYLIDVQVGLDNSARMIRPSDSARHGTAGVRA